ncbi:MAG: tetratricopeptide repeat protein [Bacteroidales bacterium]|nr:tetratricopeptide repeat protein [Bacteroidales bacterium]
MIKAGDEAMKTGATSEAIILYSKGLNIYQQIAGDHKDKSKLIHIYLNLGLAYHTKGLNIEALQIIDKAITLFGYQVPLGKIHLLAVFLYNFLYFIIAVKNEKFFFKKSFLEETENFFKAIESRSEALATISPKRLFIETFNFARLISRTNLSRSIAGQELFVGFSMLKTSNRWFNIIVFFLSFL